MNRKETTVPKSYYAAGMPIPDNTVPLEDWVDQMLKAMAAGVPVIDLGGGDRRPDLPNTPPSKGDAHE